MLMFAVISGKEGQYKSGGTFRRGYRTRLVPYQGGSYLLVELTARKVKLKKLTGFLGDTASRAVFCTGIELPEHCGIRPIDTSAIGYVFLKNAVSFWLANSGIPIQKRRTTLIDLRGVYHDLARAMAKECALLKVVTLHRESYDHLATELRAELGAVLQVTDVLDHPNDNLMLVSPKGFGVDLAGAVTVPVVTLEPDQFKGATVIYGFSRKRFDDFKLNPPERVEPLQLSAALYGIGTQLQMRTLLPESCMLDNECRTLQNVLEERFSLDTAEKI